MLIPHTPTPGKAVSYILYYIIYIYQTYIMHIYIYMYMCVYACLCLMRDAAGLGRGIQCQKRPSIVSKET